MQSLFVLIIKEEKESIPESTVWYRVGQIGYSHKSSRPYPYKGDSDLKIQKLNPTERFFGEVRKSMANQIFGTLEDQEKEIEKSVIGYYDDMEAVKKLAGYEWILEQCKGKGVF